MALPLIAINIIDTKCEDDALRQLAASVVAHAFNDYMVWTMHRMYIEQVRAMRDALYEYSVSECELEDEGLMRFCDLARDCFFRRQKTICRTLMKHPGDKAVAVSLIEKLDTIVRQETRRNETEIRAGLERLDRFFHSRLYSLYSGDAVDLDEALDVCRHEIEKEKERIR